MYIETKEDLLELAEDNEPLKRERFIALFQEAIIYDRFKVYIQPQHYLQGNDEILAAEALVRWIGKSGAVILPEYFIGTLEHCGIIYQLDRLVATRLFQFISLNRDEPWIQGMKFSVNASKEDIKLKDFVEFYVGLKEKYNIPNGMIEIEFTESTFYGDYPKFRKILQKLNMNGFSCAMDDFGTGTSSLTMLKELPIDVLKMDKNFFDDAKTENKNRNNAIIASVIAMARGLGLTIVAEGVEDIEQLKFLRKLGCDYVQGFVFSEALPMDDFVKYARAFKAYTPYNKGKIANIVSDKDELSKEVLLKRYTDALKYVNAMILEVSLNEDEYRIVTLGQIVNFKPKAFSSYSELFDAFLADAVNPDDQEIVKSKAIYKNLMTHFHRGDKELKCEFRVHSYVDSKHKFNGKYEWFEGTITFEDNAKALIYITSIQERKNREFMAQKAAKRMEYVINSIQGNIYEVDVYEDYYMTIKNINNVAFAKEGKFKHAIKKYIEDHVHEEDRKEVLKFISNDNLSACMNNENVTFVMDYREKVGDDYRWRKMSCLGTMRNDQKVYIIIQNTTAK